MTHEMSLRQCEKEMDGVLPDIKIDYQVFYRLKKESLKKLKDIIKKDNIKLFSDERWSILQEPR